MPVERRYVQYGAHNQGVLHIVCHGMFQDNSVEPLNGVHDVLRDQLSSLLHGVLVAVQLGSVPDIIQASHEDGVNGQRVPHVGALLSLL